MLIVQSKDASFKFISKQHLIELFDILDIQFGMDLDFSEIEVLSTEEVVIEPSLVRPDYVVKIGEVIFMLEFESFRVGVRKKKLFKLYISAYDYKNNDENNQIIFFVVSTKEKSKMAKYSINDWDSFTFPIISLKDLDKEEIINNIETKIENDDEFTNRELLELALTPILENRKEDIVNQFFKTMDMLDYVKFPDREIKESVYGIVLMLSSIFFDELDPIRKKLQGGLMGKIDCVTEACNESYDKGASDTIADVVKSMLRDNFDYEVISKHTGLSVGEIKELEKSL